MLWRFGQGPVRFIALESDGVVDVRSSMSNEAIRFIALESGTGVVGWSGMSDKACLSVS